MPRQTKKSFVWAAFSKIDGNNVKCNTCFSVYKLFGTTNLISHLKRKHPVLYLELSGEGNNLTTRTASSSSSILNRPCTSYSSNRPTDIVSNRPNNFEHESGQSPQLEPTTEPPTKRPRQMRIVPPTRINKKSIDDALVEMVALDHQPLQIVENVGFINYSKKLNPDYSLPSRKTLTHKLLHEKYSSCSNALKEILNQVESVSVTTDMWTSDSGRAYLSVTVHFVNESRLQSFTLSTIEMSKEHNAENISAALKSITTEWGIFDKIVACVTDNASTMKKAISDIQKRNIYCMAHTLNLAVKDCLTPNETAEKDGSSEAKEINDLLIKCRALVGHFRHSGKSSYKLQETQKQMGLPELKLKQDVATRWNATLYMIERIVKLKIPLSATLPQIQSSPANLDSSQWDILEDCMSLLGPFEKMTTILSGELYPTLSSAIPLVRGLHNVMRKKFPKTGPGLHLKELLVSVVSKRLNVYETYKTAAKSTFLDPRFKKKGFGLESNADSAQQWVSNKHNFIVSLSTIVSVENKKKIM